MEGKPEQQKNIKPESEIDPELDWEKILNDNGLGVIDEPLMVPINSAEDFLLNHATDIEKSLGRFKVLSEKIQEDILLDLEKQRDLNIPLEISLKRFELLVTKGEELETMTSEKNSDKKNHPALPDETLDEIEEKEIKSSVDQLIGRIQEIIKDKKTKKKEYIN
ncbi:MAG: hypothetical protein P4L63_02070 [Candidatus Pacebacteria bacterium]|nr:hypothetical protein [Candidatus Paceibacterota bacterium]